MIEQEALGFVNFCGALILPVAIGLTVMDWIFKKIKDVVGSV
jgi:hypothetical protein